TVIEALAAGTPVVATNVIGTRDVVQHNETGLLEPAGDVERLANAVLHYLDDPESARRMAQAGRKDVLARFSTEEMVSRTSALYDELLHVPGKREFALHPPLVDR
ncbi:MAG TPA: glycosyltransferase, partial [Chloroflexota bacterium]|nr:glycosyltransferase [Chloroflexota bacterium]